MSPASLTDLPAEMHVQIAKALENPTDLLSFAQSRMRVYRYLANSIFLDLSFDIPKELCPFKSSHFDRKRAHQLRADISSVAASGSFCEDFDRTQGIAYFAKLSVRDALRVRQRWGLYATRPAGFENMIVGGEPKGL